MSASSDTQFGFNFDADAEHEAECRTVKEWLADSVEEVEQEPASPLEVSTQSFLLPELEEEAKEREESKEPEIPWAEYTRMVQLFFNEAQHEEFRELTSKLAVLYGTKSVTDTVAEAMRNAALRSKV